jgi:hypothetical protein
MPVRRRTFTCNSGNVKNLRAVEMIHTAIKHFSTLSDDAGGSFFLSREYPTIYVIEY